MANTKKNDVINGAFTEVNGRTKQAIEKSARLVQELGDLTRGNVEALVASSKLAATGFQSLGQEAADYGRKNLEEASTAFRTFTSVKSPTDLFQVQSEFARSTLDTLVAQGTKLSETLVELSGQIAEPFASRCIATAERVKTVTFEA